MTTTATLAHPRHGVLALEYCKVRIPVQVLRSNAGYYIGTIDDEGPCSRESNEYWASKERAQAMLDSGEWTQKESP